ncbi:thioesterase II family protein [Chitinophaga rhizophila]|uniref:Thioesterase domain-containing protein n=1 Tax=Chitinophaga rhizophila TaxID=2866212 RepID=A0ABS7G5X2_9BACT|nr:thioesterase domain-containing protein [Chitinophaga rhizophila]MBW8683028.1 hypothetical protein [Chitinophaga rhizophila]
MHIIMLPFAGGNKHSYQAITGNVPNIHTLEYPGRGTRIREPLPVTLDLLVEDVLQQLKKTIDIHSKYMLYGHSMGALIAYLLCRKIKTLGLPMPQKLVVSGRKSPHIKRKRFLSQLHDADFIQEVTGMGGIPDEVLQYPELMEFIIPILKGDFRVYESYQYIPGEKLSVPIDVFYGSEEGIREEDIVGWKEESLQPVHIREMKGNHFFILDHAAYFSEYLRNHLGYTGVAGRTYP